MNSKQRFRTRVIGLGVLAAAGVLLASLYATDIVHGSDYREKADAQYTHPHASLFARGTIFFTDKDGNETAAATVESGYDLTINPRLLADPVGAYEAISRFVPLDKATFMAKAAKHDSYEEIMDKLSESVGQSIQELGIPGVVVVPETWRAYPGGTLAAHLLGITGENASSSAVTGKYGLEREYDAVLSRTGMGSSVNAFAQLFSGLTPSFGTNKDSGDIVTTIEPTVQAYLEKILAETDAQWHPDEIGGIIMDPNTGDVVAMATHPSYDPNDLANLPSAAVLSDPLVEHVYEMGSIMKPLTMSAAIDSGTVTASSTYDDVGCMVLDDKRICNWDHRARGITDMQQLLSQSLNIGAATISLKMGPATLRKYFESFGITSKTGIDLPNEAYPITDALDRGTKIDVATASYGQGIALSPIGMARALSVIANGGYVVTPRLVKEIDYADGTVEKIPVERTGPVLKPQTVDDVKMMLVKVVDVALAYGHIKMDHFTMAAKTGTAMIADHVHGGYYPNRYLHSFFGFLPAYNSRFIIFLYQIYPKGAEYASETLTTPYDELAKFLINYYNIPPDR